MKYFNHICSKHSVVFNIFSFISFVYFRYPVDKRGKPLKVGYSLRKKHNICHGVLTMTYIIYAIYEWHKKRSG